MSSLFKRVYVPVRNFAQGINTANAIRHGAPVNPARQQHHAGNKRA